MPDNDKCFTKESLSQFPNLAKFLESSPPDATLLKPDTYQTLYSGLEMNGWHLGDHKWSLIEILSFLGYKTHIEALKLTPKQLEDATKNNHCEAIRWAMRNHRHETTRYLAAYLDQNELKSILTNKEDKPGFFSGIIIATSENDVPLLTFISEKLTPDELKSALKQRNFEAIYWTFISGHLDILETLKSFLSPDELTIAFKNLNYLIVRGVIEFSQLKMLQKLEEYLTDDEIKQAMTYRDDSSMTPTALLVDSFCQSFHDKPALRILKLTQHAELLHYLHKFLKPEDAAIKKDLKRLMGELINRSVIRVLEGSSDKKNKITPEKYKEVLTYLKTLLDPENPKDHEIIKPAYAVD